MMMTIGSKKYWLLMLIGLVTLNSCETKEKSNEAKSESPPYELRMTLEHDPEAYTQGLVFYNGKVLESTGGTNSWIAEYDISSGKYGRKINLDRKYFGEGITVLNNKIFQLTWKGKKGFIYNVNTLEKIGEFNYDHEGWGITHDGKHLIVSDGTDQLHFLDTANYSELFKISVRDNSQKTTALNELEFIDGHVFANQWETNLILKIDPSSGQIVTKYDLRNLAERIKRSNPDADVLNGIAYNEKTGDVLVTGKNWPQSFVIRFRK